MTNIQLPCYMPSYYADRYHLYRPDIICTDLRTVDVDKSAHLKYDNDSNFAMQKQMERLDLDRLYLCDAILRNMVCLS